jgi:hypothetical protein
MFFVFDKVGFSLKNRVFHTSKHASHHSKRLLEAFRTPNERAVVQCTCSVACVTLARDDTSAVQRILLNEIICPVTQFAVEVATTISLTYKIQSFHTQST